MRVTSRGFGVVLGRAPGGAKCVCHCLFRRSAPPKPLSVSEMCQIHPGEGIQGRVRVGSG
jgi:hypothetical protein